MDRKLASIQKIIDIQEHNNADSLSIAKVLGWTVVASKNEFNIGDMVIYVEVDSVLPDSNPYFKFLENKKYRIKTIRLRGVISQGICFPVSILPEGTEIIEGKDVTEILKIKLYEPPNTIDINGEIAGQRPSYIPKTDVTRLQSIPEILTQYQNEIYWISEKLDGTSSSYALNNGEFSVCSRKLNLKENENNIFWKVANKYKIKEKLKELNRNIVLQGEIIGDKIQGNKYKIIGHELYLFDIFDIDRYQYVNFDEFLKLAYQLDMKTVPIIENKFSIKNKTIDELLRMSDNFSIVSPSFSREGLVFKSIQEKWDMKIGRIQFKVVSQEFLLENDE
ncbi:MAG: RNA ligase (ATP) [Candidatus Nanoarchaeia archaeon]|nr:RNA ligase (ATP) [Candidatus Nanoarchaeia archaeon]